MLNVRIKVNFLDAVFSACFFCSLLVILATIPGIVNSQRPPNNNNSFKVKDLKGKWSINNIYICDSNTGKIKDLCTGLNYTLIFPSEEKMAVEIEEIRLFQWSFELDINKMPVWIDLTPTLPQAQEMKMGGIIKIEEPFLFIHVSDLSLENRPLNFRQQKGISSILFRCKRSGPLEKDSK